MQYKTKRVSFELKDFDEEAGVFTKTLEENKGRVKICWQYDPYRPIGKAIEIREDKKGLFVKGQISDTSLGKDVKILMKDGVINDGILLEFPENESLNSINNLLHRG
ncbi:HK97 family phage prohead protease [Orenia marismortui]|uniref:HK97 family phage prohead protease n=1 Tax=Orenia marismortui TaxID=46469 RepID=A0A4R8H6P0_9FIRM|nr:HK97 family phage prohead protease [Orenia marismortui]TDX53246.1 HK97 family phage prohead protease [Orenia marismortui]